MNHRAVIIVFFGAVLALGCAYAAEYFVDKDSTGGSCSDSNPGTISLPFCTLAKGVLAASAGDTVNVRGGNYHEALHISKSGSPGNYITFKSYQEESAAIANVDSIDNGENYGPIWLDHASYIIIDGFTVRGSVGFTRSVRSNYNTIQNCNFDGSILYPGESKRGSLYFWESNYNRIINNRIFEGTDAMSIIHSDHNVIEGNNFTDAGHTNWRILCGSFNVFRNNSMSNQVEKLGELMDCETATANWHGNYPHQIYTPIQDSTHFNLFENNRFGYNPPAIDQSPFSGIQFAGQDTIVRNNLFYDEKGPGLSLGAGSEEQYACYDNHVYNNVFYNNEYGAVTFGTLGALYYHNPFINNVFYKNKYTMYDDRWPLTHEMDGKNVQLLGGLDGLTFHYNAFEPYDDYAFVHGNRNAGRYSPAKPLPDWEISNPTMFSNNIFNDPEFIDAAGHDFGLQSDSQLVDRGAFPTTTTGAGSGITITVADAGFFYDGFGIPGEVGDAIQLEGSDVRARIVNIDYDNNRITINTSLTWTQGQGVGLPYTGTGPDIGAFELGLDDSGGPVYDPNCVTDQELLNFIARWKSGNAIMKDLLATIMAWRGGC